MQTQKANRQTRPPLPARSSLKILVCGHSRIVDGFSVDSPSGFAVWLERQGHCVVLPGHRTARLVFSCGAPYIDIFHVADDGISKVRDMRVPCVDIIGLAP